jgi:hypothetical protein
MDGPSMKIDRLTKKIWGGRNSEALLSKRFKIFVILAIVLIALSKLLYLHGITFPNLELIIPTLVVVSSFSLYCGESKYWRRLTRYFGIAALVSVYLIDMKFWGFRTIYIFTWSGFLIAWLLGLRNKLSMFDKYKKLLYRTALTTAVAILIFDVWTCFGTWLFWYPRTVAGLIAAFLAQIPFTLYHLSSLVFVPPLVGMAKLMSKVKVPVAIAVPAKSGARSTQRG